MGYYLPITDYQGQQYRRRVERTGTSPYHIEQSYKVVFDRISQDDPIDGKLLYQKAKKQTVKKEPKKRKRFSGKDGKVEGKGEHINVQV